MSMKGSQIHLALAHWKWHTPWLKNYLSLINSLYFISVQAPLDIRVSESSALYATKFSATLSRRADMVQDSGGDGCGSNPECCGKGDGSCNSAADIQWVECHDSDYFNPIGRAIYWTYAVHGQFVPMTHRIAALGQTKQQDNHCKWFIHLDISYF
jgi:hypothetical protein